VSCTIIFRNLIEDVTKSQFLTCEIHPIRYYFRKASGVARNFFLWKNRGGCMGVARRVWTPSKKIGALLSLRFKFFRRGVDFQFFLLKNPNKLKNFPGKEGTNPPIPPSGQAPEGGSRTSLDIFMKTSIHSYILEGPDTSCTP